MEHMLNIQNGQYVAVSQSMGICHLAWLLREMWLKRQISVSSPNPEPLPNERLSDDLLKSSYPNDAPLFVYPVQLAALLCDARPTARHEHSR